MLVPSVGRVVAIVFKIEQFPRLSVVHPAKGVNVSPADLPWWGWMLCGAVGAIVSFCSATYAVSKSEKPGRQEGSAFFIAVVFCLAAFACGVIGMLRYAKRVWGN